jgi:ABC-type transporter Mla subunit MlaD
MQDPSLQWPDLETHKESLGAQETTSTSSRTEPPPLAKATATWTADLKQRTSELVAELLAPTDKHIPEERALLRLAASTIAIVETLDRTLYQLSARAALLVDNPQALLPIIRALKEVTKSTAANRQSLAALLETAATIKSQRQLLAKNRKEAWHDELSGGNFSASRRNSASRSAAAN